MRWAVLWVLLIGLVLLPFLLFEQQFDAFGEQITRSDASRWLVAAAVFSLLALDVFLPVPSSIVSTALGYRLVSYAGTLVVWGGMMAGACWDMRSAGAGSASGEPWSASTGSRGRAAVKRYGDLTIVLCRPVPVLAEASVVFAGLVRSVRTPDSCD